MSFSEILGQEKAKGFLLKAMERGKIPHAYLFTGISGVGKTTMARALVMSLSCANPVRGDSCGQCKTCRQIQGGNFPDFMLIEPEGQNIKIDQIRELNRSVGFAPLSGPYRVCVLQRAESMTEEAANSFLKTLEEPPPGNVFVLSVTEPLDLLPTIVSRCQKIPFEPLPAPEIRNWLLRNEHADQELAEILAELCGGSLGRAIDMWESGFHEKRQEWLQSLMRLPGLSKEKALAAALQWVGEGKKKNRDASQSAQLGLLGMLGVWESWYRDLLLVKVGGPEVLIINSDFVHKLKNTAKKFKLEFLMESFFALDRAQRALRKNRNAALVLEHCVLSLNSLAGEGEPFRKHV